LARLTRRGSRSFSPGGIDDDHRSLTA
jgi:hypothetical protein